MSNNPTLKVRLRGKWFSIAGGGQSELTDEVLSYVDELRRVLERDLEDLDENLGGLYEFINGAFKDGIISETEARRILNLLKEVESSKKSLDMRYDEITENEYLSSQVRTYLETLKDTYDTRFDDLVDVVTQIANADEVTDHMWNDFEDRYNLYGDALAFLVTYFEKAIEDIARNYTNQARKEAMDHADDGFDILESRVVNAESSISTNATEIALRVLKTEHQDAIGAAREYAEEKAQEYSDAVKSDILQDLGDLSGELDDTKDYINTAFRDGIISQTEAKKIAQYLNTISSIKLSMDERYNELYNNPNLFGVDKSNLYTAKQNHDTKYSALVQLIMDIVAQGTASPQDAQNVDNAFDEYNLAISMLTKRIEAASDYIGSFKASKALQEANEYTDDELFPVMDRVTETESELVTQAGQIAIRVKQEVYEQGLSTTLNSAQQYTDTAKLALETYVGELEEDLDETKTYLDGAFKDGIIYDAEYRKIQGYLNSLDSSKKTFDARYEEIYYNPYLSGTPKTNLNIAKDIFDDDYQNLIDGINDVISNRQVTESESQQIDALFVEYNNAISLLSKSLELAIDAIAQAKMNEALDSANEYADAIKGDLEEQLSQLSSDLTNMEGTIKEGLIGETDARRLASYVNTITTSKDSIDERFDEVYNNEYLFGVPKLDLNQKKSDLDHAHTQLINKLNSIRDAGVATAQDIIDVDNRFADYNNRVKDISRSFDKALDYIAQARAGEAFDDSIEYVDYELGIIENRVSEAESELVTQAGLIASRVTEDTYNTGMNAIDGRVTTAQNTANSAQQSADSAASAASTAQATADSARTEAETANNQLADISSDNKLTPVQKQMVLKEWESIQEEKPKIEAQADKFGVSKSAYTSAYNALDTYISPYLSAPNATSDIDGQVFRQRFRDYYNQRVDILNLISEEAKDRADAAQSTADTAKTIAEKATTDLGLLDTRVESNESSISQQAGQIQQRVTTTTFEAGIGEAKQYADDLDVGTRNLVENSNFRFGTDNWSETQGEIVQDGIFSDYGFKLESTLGNSHILTPETSLPQGRYIATIWIKHVSGHRPYLFGGSGIVPSFTPTGALDDAVTGRWSKIVLPFRVTSGSGGEFYGIRYSANSPAQHSEGVSIIGAIKIEEGHKSTSWTPAHEDIEREGKKYTESLTGELGYIVARGATHDGNYLNPPSPHGLELNIKEKGYIGYCTMYSEENNNNVRAELWDENEQVIDTREIILDQGRNKVYLGFMVEEGTYYLMSGSQSERLARTDAGYPNYPYEYRYMDIVQGHPVDNRYYYFFDIEFTTFEPVGVRVSRAESVITQHANQISSKVEQEDYNGEVISSLINQTAGSVSIQAKAIDFTLGGPNDEHGVLRVLDANGDVITDIDSELGGFSRIQVVDLTVAGTLTASNVVQKSYENMEIYVRGDLENSSDDNGGTSWEDALYSIQEAIDRLAQVYNGSATILVSNRYNHSENVSIDGIIGAGQVEIDLRGNKCRGYMQAINCTVRIDIRNGEIERNSGNIYCINNSGSQYMVVHDMIINGAGHSHGVRTWRSGSTYIGNTQVYNCQNGFTADNLGRVHVQSGCAGLVSNAGLYARSSGRISGWGGIPLGQDSVTDAGQGAIISTTSSWSPDSGTATPPAPPVTEQTQTWVATSSANWRNNHGGQWNGGSHSTPVQGDWDGWGHYRGFWFQSTNMRNTLQGATIKRVRIRASRINAGGNGGNVGIVFRMHNYTSRPSSTSTPSHSNTSQTVNFARGDTKRFTLDPSFHSLMTNGNWVGFGIFTTSTANSRYAIMTGRLEIEVTYES